MPEFDYVPSPERVPPAAAPRKKRRTLKIVGFVVGGLFLCGVGAAVGSTSSPRPVAAARVLTPGPATTVTVPGPATTVAVPGPATTVTVPGPATTVTVVKEVQAPASDPATTAAAPADSVGPGTYLVGTDIKPGTYRSAGATPDSNGGRGDCYWARLRSTNTSDILDNDISTGQAVVTIKPTDAAFTTNGCQGWIKIG